MRRLTFGTSLAAGILTLGCADQPPTAPVARRPQFEISDAGHTSGTPGFYFLPPMVSAPTFTGTFVGGLAPAVVICVWNGTACDALTARFTTETGPGSETVRVEDEQYHVTWHTGEFGLDPAKIYRIRVLLGSTELGHADVAVVATGRERNNVNTAEFVPVVNGQTLPIEFRIEDGAILAIAVGAMRTWYNTTQNMDPDGILITDADSHTASWNNFQMRFYGGCTSGPPPTFGTCGADANDPTRITFGTYPRIEWQNNATVPQGLQIEAYWYGYLAALSSANDVVRAIRTNGAVITNAATTRMVEAMAVLVQGLALSGLALNYDKAFILDENTPLDANGSPIVAFSGRTAVRNAALAKFDDVIALATAHVFTARGDFFDNPGVTYDNARIAQIASTMAARTLAYFPRDAAENATVDWVRVASYASRGISSGTAFDWVFKHDGCVNWCDFLKNWSNDMTTMRVHTRVAHLMDPTTQPDPWNAAANSEPIWGVTSFDTRLGDGRYGPVGVTDTVVTQTRSATANSGTDYAWSFDKEIFPGRRGAWHQSAIGQIRYISASFISPGGTNPDGGGSIVDLPIVLAAENDLIWAEALIRSGGSLAAAAGRINNSRVGRGGLPALTGAEPQAQLLGALQYELDVELPGSNVAPFYNQRRIDRLEPFTAHEMPVPAKQLEALHLPLYTWGGAGNPPNSTPTASASTAAALVQSAPQVWAELQRQARAHRSAILRRQ